MSATVATAAVETATTVEAATAAHCAATDCYMSSAATEPATSCAASCESTTSESAAFEAAPKATSAETGTSAEAAAEPWASSDKEAAGEPARTVVTVRRTGVWVISIIAVGANGSRSNIARSDAHANHHALGAGVRCQGQGSSKYRKYHEIFDEMFHFWAPSEPVKPFCL
jgi:hypothetical protein